MSDGENKIFPHKQKLREFIISRPKLHEKLKEALKIEIKGNSESNAKLYKA